MPYYAVTRSLTPAGDVAFDASLSSWTQGAPMVEVIERVLRTPRGSYPLDPSFGLDVSDVQKNAANSAARFRNAIIAALKYLTDAKLITQLSVTVEATGAALKYLVVFIDPRVSTTDKQTVTGVR